MLLEATMPMEGAAGTAGTAAATNGALGHLCMGREEDKCVVYSERGGGKVLS